MCPIDLYRKCIQFATNRDTIVIALAIAQYWYITVFRKFNHSHPIPPLKVGHASEPIFAIEMPLFGEGESEKVSITGSGILNISSLATVLYL